MTNAADSTGQSWRNNAMRSGLLFLNFFLILLAYYHVKPASRSLFLEHSQASVLPWVWTLSGVILLALMPSYQRLLQRYQRIHVVLATCGAVVALLLMFRALLPYAGFGAAVGFYVLVDIFSVVLVEQFWSLTNAAYSREEGRRWYGLIGSGGLVGGMVGGLSAGWLLQHTTLDTQDLILVAAGLVAVMMWLTLRLARMGVYAERDPANNAKEPAMADAAEVWASLRSNRFVGLIALTLFFAQICEPLVEFQFMRAVEGSFADQEQRTVYLSHFLSLLSGLALLVNLIVMPFVHRYLGLIGGLVAQPLALSLTALGHAFNGGLTSAAVMKLSDRSLNYSINRASRELLYVSASASTIFRVKGWVDVVGYRLFKIGGNLIIIVMTSAVPLALGNGLMAGIVFCTCAAWLAAIPPLRRLALMAKAESKLPPGPPQNPGSGVKRGVSLKRAMQN